MKTFLKTLILLPILAGLAGCNEDFGICSIAFCSSDSVAAETPAAPAAATEVLEDEHVTTFEYDGIINRNIQNLLCNSVHHARAGRFDQAEQKLLLAKDEKLPALLDKNRITEEQFVSLDDWMAELEALLNEDMTAYADVDNTFPFDCEGVSEESEAISEVVESEVDPADGSEGAPEGESQFVRMVCYSAFATRDLRLVAAVDYLNTAINIAREEHGLSSSSWKDTFYILDGIVRLKLRTVCQVYRADYDAL